MAWCQTHIKLISAWRARGQTLPSPQASGQISRMKVDQVKVGAAADPTQLITMMHLMLLKGQFGARGDEMIMQHQCVPAGDSLFSITYLCGFHCLCFPWWDDAVDVPLGYLCVEWGAESLHWELWEDRCSSVNKVLCHTCCEGQQCVCQWWSLWHYPIILYHNSILLQLILNLHTLNISKYFHRHLPQYHFRPLPMLSLLCLF